MGAPTLAELTRVFTRIGCLSFGGPAGQIALMQRELVDERGWLSPGEMADGLGLAETTPGPLIMVTQFVGCIAAWRHPGDLSPLGAGVLGAGLTTWVTFAPCFLWIFVGAPWLERVERIRAIAATGQLTAGRCQSVAALLRGERPVNGAAGEGTADSTSHDTDGAAKHCLAHQRPPCAARDQAGGAAGMAAVPEGVAAVTARVGSFRQRGRSECGQHGDGKEATAHRLYS